MKSLLSYEPLNSDCFKSNIVMRINNNYFIESYNEEGKVLYQFNTDSFDKTIIMTYSHEEFLAVDSFLNKIYLYKIYDKKLYINSAMNNDVKYEVVIQDKDTFAEQLIINDNIVLAKLFSENEEKKKVLIILLDTNKIFDIRESDFINSNNITFLRVNNTTKILLDTSSFLPFELPEIRKKQDELAIEEAQNEIHIYDMNEFIKSLEEKKKVDYIVLDKSHGDDFVAVLGNNQSNLFIWKNSIRKVLCYNNIEAPISIDLPSMPKVIFGTKIYYYLDNPNTKIYNENGKLLKEFVHLELEDEIEIDTVESIIEDRFIIFNAYNYKSEQKQIRIIYDMETSKFEIEDCEHIIIDKEII